MQRILCFFLLYSFSLSALANEVSIPEPLKPWKDWVLHDYTPNTCPSVYNQINQQRICAWPSPLKLNLDNHTGTFSQSWQLWQDAWVYLPGNTDFWPQQVKINGQVVVVGQENERPRVWLKKGSYTITGQWSWSQLPESLSLAAGTALVDLAVNQQAVALPSLQINNDDDISLMLHDKRQVNQNAQENSQSIEVFRRVVDEIPMTVTTRIALHISGEAREMIVPPVLLPHSTPLSLNSDVPFKLENDGSLRVQARPGQWSIELTSRMAGNLEQLTLPKTFHNEIWVFEARPNIRHVEVTGVTQLDPRQTRLPPDWQNLPAYQMNAAQQMHFKLLRRGNPSPAANNLNLTRKIWLDFAGTGYTIQDVIQGNMNQGWRLQMNQPYSLNRANLNGEDQLVTHTGNPQQSGVEIRDNQFNLVAESRISQASMSNLGWQHEFNQVSGELNLPPGYRLLHMSGVDKVADSWVQQWTLLDIFLTLIIVLTIHRLWGVPAALIATATLLLTWHETDAPKWIWLNLLAVIALLRVLPDSKVKQKLSWYRWLSLASLLLIFLNFAVDAVRQGLYPQLEYQGTLYNPQSPSTGDETMGASSEELLSKQQAAPMMDSAIQESAPAPAAPMPSKEEGVYSMYAEPTEGKVLNTPAQGKQQTGLGLPAWHWNKTTFSWSGPVNADQAITLWLLTPTLSLIWNFLSVLLIGALLFIFADRLPRRNTTQLPKGLLGVMLCCLLAIFALTHSPSSWAEAPPELNASAINNSKLPDQSLLNELKRRLIAAQEKAPQCNPNCVLSPNAQLSVQNDVLTLQMELHAATEVAVPLPFASNEWMPQNILLNGKAVSGLRLHQQQAMLLLSPGVHQLSLSGRLPAVGSLRLPWPLAPHQLNTQVDGWQVQGVNDGHVAGDLQLIRQQKTSFNNEPSETSNGQSLPPFVLVHRNISLGLEWQVETVIERVGDTNSTVSLEIPLLSDESVLSENIPVKDGKAQLILTAGEESVRWLSNLKISSQLKLQSPNNALWMERWRITPSALWRIDYQGIPEVLVQANNTWSPEWWPWQNEVLNIKISRPAGIDGSTLTIDESTLTVEPGSRVSNITYQFKLRTSQGGQQMIPLPEGAKLQKLWINNVEQAIQPERNNVPLNLTPGMHQIKIIWQQNQGISGLYHTPSFNHKIPSANQSILLNVPENRWILFTGGPSFGPAVLFWGVLIVILLASAALARSRYTPLNMRQWLLLGVGLSQLPILFACIVASWFFAISWRSKHRLSDDFQFNAAQIGIVILSLASILLLLSAVWQGLLGAPDMQIVGNGSFANSLNWYQDRSDGLQASAWVISVPLFVYRLLMLLWSLWLAFSVLRWIQWGWAAFSQDGLWRKMPKIDKPVFNKPRKKSPPDVEESAKDTDEKHNQP